MYIGITGRPVKRRYDNGNGYKHCSHFWSAIKKYGWENFSHAILESGLSKDDALEREKIYIALFRSQDPKYGYNISAGGEMPSMSNEARKALSDRMRGINNPTVKYGHPMLGKHHSKESKSLMSYKASIRKRERMSESTKEKLRKAHSNEAKPVFCEETEVRYESIHEAANKTNIPATKICAVLKGRRHTAGGLHWRYD